MRESVAAANEIYQVSLRRVVTMMDTFIKGQIDAPANGLKDLKANERFVALALTGSDDDLRAHLSGLGNVAFAELGVKIGLFDVTPR